MSIQQLIKTLEQKVQQLHQTYSAQHEEKIFVKFDRTLFSENGQTTAFYFNEIEQTLTKIKFLNSNDVNHYTFITELLLKQCTALSEALNRKSKPLFLQKQQKPTPIRKTQHEIHKLPPRERLEKYYEALEQLNRLYQQHRDLAHTETHVEKQKKALQLAKQYKQRRQKCQEAIDLLEEYLAFKEEQENRNNQEK
ncbi:primosomal replication protein PriC [Rodentibacter haemolyticus]|uniref:Primosomal replication protein n=1 Tax=Rodentibacter haemolyticus TaxID=2778911 RepID=A0ABX6UY90_9PAST|nr:primosomal replication protein PriC [Rodentibacter haemolyticus]QPB42061.1 primosomal replication protein [Rodentibacter haemolyticus]